MKQSSRLIYASAFIIAGAGFLWPLWPLCVLGILIASLSGRWLFGAVIGLLIDIAWGPPAGVLHYVFFPFTLLAIVSGILYIVLSGYFLDRTPPDTL